MEEELDLLLDPPAAAADAPGYEALASRGSKSLDGIAAASPPSLPT